MSNQQLALPAPYGYNDGYHVTLTAKDGFDEVGAMDVVMSFGCPRRVAGKAIDCLRASNRYDCVMSPQAWNDGQYRDLRGRLQNIGCDIELRSRPNYNDPGQPARFARQAEQRAYHTREGGERNGYRYAQAQNLPRRLERTSVDLGRLGVVEFDTYDRIQRVLDEVRALRYRK
jgi:hypothetical protein